jgi:hypothetical protein
MAVPFAAGPMVRIRFPPAVSRHEILQLPGRPEIYGGCLGLSLAEIAEMRECGVI